MSKEGRSSCLPAGQPTRQLLYKLQLWKCSQRAMVTGDREALHQEAKMKEKDAQDGEVKKAFLASSQQKQRRSELTFKCHFWGKIGHFKRDHRNFMATQSQGK